MHISMNTTSSRRVPHGWGNFGLEIRKMLAKAFEHLSLNFSAITTKRVAGLELKNRDARQCEVGYEATKRKLLAALRRKISEKQTKTN